MESSSSTQKKELVLSSPLNPAHYFAYASSLYLFVLSLPLLLFPRILLLLSTPRGAVGQAVDPTLTEGGAGGTGGAGGNVAVNSVSALGPELTPIERFASYAWGITMITLALTSIVQTGAIPLTSAPLAPTAASGAPPTRFPSVLLLVLYFLVLTVLSYSSAGTASSAVEASSSKELGLGTFAYFIAAPSALLALWGTGVLMFGGDLTRNRKKAGDADAKDGATSSWPFKNTYAEEEKKK